MRRPCFILTVLTAAVLFASACSGSASIDTVLSPQERVPAAGEEPTPAAEEPVDEPTVAERGVAQPELVPEVAIDLEPDAVVLVYASFGGCSDFSVPMCERWTVRIDGSVAGQGVSFPEVRSTGRVDPLLVEELLAELDGLDVEAMLAELAEGPCEAATDGVDDELKLVPIGVSLDTCIYDLWQSDHPAVVSALALGRAARSSAPLDFAPVDGTLDAPPTPSAPGPGAPPLIEISHGGGCEIVPLGCRSWIVYADASFDRFRTGDEIDEASRGPERGRIDEALTFELLAVLSGTYDDIFDDLAGLQPGPCESQVDGRDLDIVIVPIDLAIDTCTFALGRSEHPVIVAALAIAAAVDVAPVDG